MEYELMFSIIIPTLNNLKFLKFCIESIRKNSKFTHEIIPHVNIGNDGTLDYSQEHKIDFSYTNYNSGICKGMNLAAKKAKTDYILKEELETFDIPQTEQIEIPEPPAKPSVPIASEDDFMDEDYDVFDTDFDDSYDLG